MLRDTWTLGHLSRESTKNVFSHRSRLYSLLILAVAIGVALPTYAAWESVQLRNQLDQEALAGRNVLLVTALDTKQPAVIDRRSCEQLTRDADVQAAGILQREPSQNYVQVGANVPTIGASATLVPALNQDDAVVGSALRKKGPAFRMLMPDGTVRTAVVGAAQPDVIGSNSSVVVGLAPDVTSSSTCFVVLSPLARGTTVAPRLVAELVATGGPLTATQQFTEPRDPIDTFNSRPTQYLPLLLGLAGGIAAGMLNRARTGEWAAYRMSGTSPRSLLIIQFLEQASVAGFMAFTSGITAVALSGYLISFDSTALAALSGAALWVIVATLLTVDMPLRKPTNLAKDH